MNDDIRLGIKQPNALKRWWRRNTRGLSDLIVALFPLGLALLIPAFVYGTILAVLVIAVVVGVYLVRLVLGY